MDKETEKYLRYFLFSILSLMILWTGTSTSGVTPMKEQPTMITKCVGFPGACTLTTQPGEKVVYHVSDAFGDFTRTVVYEPNDVRDEEAMATTRIMGFLLIGLVAFGSGLALIIRLLDK